MTRYDKVCLTLGFTGYIMFMMSPGVGMALELDTIAPMVKLGIILCSLGIAGGVVKWILA